MPAFYDCKLCEGVHRLPGQFPTKALFDSVPIHQHVCTCPEVERGAIYRESDVFWRDDRGPDRPTGDERSGWKYH